MPFLSRRDAGERLAQALSTRPFIDPVVVALPRGGVPVAFEVSERLGVPLEVLIVRKLGAPSHPEYGIGAIAEDGQMILDAPEARATGVNGRTFGQILRRELIELGRRLDQYRGAEGPPSVRGRDVVLVDDGVATGLTDLAALRCIRGWEPRSITVAVPVGSREAVARLADEADEVVCLEQPEDFVGVGKWYEDFAPTTDREVLSLLERSLQVPRPADERPQAPAPYGWRSVAIPAGPGLEGVLRVPPAAKGLIVFAHGSGSSRHSPRNIAVAEHLAAEGFATLLLDLLTPTESDERSAVFDVTLLSERLTAATQWCANQPDVFDLPVGLFGASTGAAAALQTAATLGTEVFAVVSRGGRPDLAGSALPSVLAPTLLIVGSEDHQVLELNRRAAQAMRCVVQTEIVAGAGHLFEEPGALDEVADLATTWFFRYARTPLPLTRSGRNTHA